MNGIHDLGGMHGFGPIPAGSEGEPVFREAWEARVFAISMGLGDRALWTIDEDRHAIERIPPERYLTMSYYERWLAGIERLLLELDVLPPGWPEHPPKGSRQASEAARNGGAESVPDDAAADAFTRPMAKPPAFAVGQRVRARNIHPAGHTRLPRYARGRAGVVERIHGAHVLPDTNAHGSGECPEPLYGVAFNAAELWGDAEADGDGVHLDLWESYLEPL